MFSGPEYTFEQRWVARIATVVLMFPFLPIAYGIGYATGLALGDDIPGDDGVVCAAMFVGLLSAMWLGQWFKGFRQ